MPLYDFQCIQCDTVQELLTRSGDLPLCPSCRTEMVRLLSKPQAPSRTAEFIKQSRAQAAREGHFSNYSASERPKIS